MATLTIEKFRDLIEVNRLKTLSVNEAYKTIGYFRQCINRVANGFVNLPYSIMQDSEVIWTEAGESVTEEQEDEALTKSVNLFEVYPALKIFNLFNYIAKDIKLYGAFYATFESNRFGTKTRWRRIHPDRVTPVYDDQLGLKHFKLETKHSTILMEPGIGTNKLLYIWQDIQVGDFGAGEPDAEGALISATILKYSNGTTSKFFENGAISPALVGIEGLADRLVEEQEETRNIFQRLFSGYKKSFQVVPIDGKTTLQRLQSDFKTIGIDKIVHLAKEDIATALGVPQSLVMSNAANFATANQDTFNFYDQTIVPLGTSVEQQLNERLFGLYGFELKFNPERLDAFQAVEFAKVQSVVPLLNSKVVTINEVRAMLGLPPIEEEEEAPPPMEREEEPEESEEEPEDEELNELKKWRTFAVRRFKEGKPEKLMAFKATKLQPAYANNIQTVLSDVTSIESIHRVFAEAEASVQFERLLNAGYPQ